MTRQDRKEVDPVTEGKYPMDDHLQAYVDKYAGWKAAGPFPFSGRVIPVQASFTPQQKVLPREQAMEVLRSARSFALTDCVCRAHYRRCDAPLDVCFLIDELADKAVSRGRARRVPFDVAAERLKAAEEHGLVHITYYQPGRKVYAFCSCCACCCHDLLLLLQHGRTDLVARSDYIAATDAEHCTSCGLCTGRCVFGARIMDGGAFAYDEKSCMGCGLCVSVCPEQATVMKLRRT